MESKGSGHSFVSDNIVEEILCRLPTKASVSRLKCVSKSWNTLIASPSFTRRFNSLCPLSGLIINRSRSVQYSMNNDDQVLCFPSDPDNQFAIYASSDGLLLCEHHELFIYNPVTEEQRPIPDDPDPITEFFSLSLAFGFHVYDELRYMVVRVFCSSANEVLILKMDSAVGQWTKSSHRILSPHVFRIHIDQAATIVKGKFYWVTNRGAEIAIYDPEVGEEGSLHVIKSPLAMTSSGNQSWCWMRMVILGEYKGRLSCCSVDMKNMCFAMSVLDEDGTWSTLNTTASFQAMRDEHKQVVGTDTIPYLICFNAGDPGAVFLEWRQPPRKSERVVGFSNTNIIRHNMITSKVELVTKITDRKDSELIKYFSFNKPRKNSSTGQENQ